jgi:hypothetical protein
MDDLIEAKRDVLRKLVTAYSSIRDLYYRRDMLAESVPECQWALEKEIQRMRKDLAGA